MIAKQISNQTVWAVENFSSKTYHQSRVIGLYLNRAATQNYPFQRAITDEQPNKHCAACNLDTFEEFKQMKQEQILIDLLKKLELPSKPNVTVDYDNLPPVIEFELTQSMQILRLAEQTHE